MVQARARQGDFALLKYPGARIPAGMLTKAANQELTNRHTQAVGLSFQQGRPSTAPFLDGFSWDQAAVPSTAS